MREPNAQLEVVAATRNELVIVANYGVDAVAESRGMKLRRIAIVMSGAGESSIAFCAS